MSTPLIVAIVLGGTVLFLAGIAVLLFLLLRNLRQHRPASAEETRQAMAAYGWSFAERDDSIVSLYDRQYDHRGGLGALFDPPRAQSARDVITGTHRGRPFVAATFDTIYQGSRKPERAIWVATPSAHPLLSMHRIVGPQNALNDAIGRGGVQTGHPEFDRRFEVRCEVPAFAQAVLAPAVIELLLSDPRDFRGITFRGESLDATDPVDHRDADQLMTALDLRCDVLDRVPPHVWEPQLHR